MSVLLFYVQFIAYQIHYMHETMTYYHSGQWNMLMILKWFCLGSKQCLMFWWRANGHAPPLPALIGHGKHIICWKGALSRVSRSSLPLCLQPSPLNNLSPNLIVSVWFQVLYVYRNGALGKAAIQSHSLPIDDLNIADPPTTPLVHWLYLVHWFSCHTSMAGGTLRASTLTNYVKPMTASWCSTPGRTQGKPALPWSQVGQRGGPTTHHDHVMVVARLVAPKASQRYLGPRFGLMGTPCHQVAAWPLLGKTVIRQLV